MSLLLNCDAAWVSCPEHVEMTNISRNIQVRVDPTGLECGKVHSTFLKGYDVGSPEKGAVFHFMITVVKPHVFTDACSRPFLKFKDVFKPGQVHRHFLLVPDQVSYATVTLCVNDEDKGGNFVLHALQLRPMKGCRTQEFHKTLAAVPPSDVSASFKVKGGVILELALAKGWMEQEATNLRYTISFQGCRPDSESFTMHHGEGVMSFDVLGGLQHEEIYPAVQLRHNVQMLKPVDSKISPLPAFRDKIPPSRHIYQLLQTYNLHIPKQTEITPNCSLLSDLLYESEFESQLWMLFDSNKQLLGTGDAYPNKYSLKLEKGDYMIKLQIRHEKRELLEKLSELPIQVHMKLPSPINLDVYISHSQALIMGKKINGINIFCGKTRQPLYIAPLHGEKSLKNITVGQYLTGSLTLSKNELVKKVDTYPFKYILGDLGTKKNASTSNKPEKTKWEEYQEAMRDLKTNWLAKMDKQDEAEKLYTELKTDFPSHIPAHISMISTLEPESKKPYPGGEESTDSLETIKKIMELATTAIENVDANEILAHYGTKADHRSDANLIKLAMERQKNSLVEALWKKGVAASRAFIHQSNSDTGDGGINVTLESIDEIWLSLLKHVEPNDYKTLGYFGIWHAVAHKNYGRAIKYGIKLYEEKPSKELEAFISWAARNLGWNFYSEHLQRSTLVRFPPAYRLF